MTPASPEPPESSRPPRPPPEGPRAPSPGASLCPACRHVHLVTSARGSTFYLCTRSRTDPRYPKYPPQPVRACPGYER